MRTRGQACDRSYNDFQDIITEKIFIHANVNVNQHHIACRKVYTKTWGNAVCNGEVHNQHKCHKFILCLVSVLCRNQLLQNCSGNDEGTLEVDNNNEKSFGGVMSHTHKQGVGLQKFAKQVKLQHHSNRQTECSNFGDGKVGEVEWSELLIMSCNKGDVSGTRSTQVYS